MKTFELGAGLEIREVAVDQLREQDVNARYMDKSLFDRMAKTVARDNRLESLPLCADTDQGVEIISGHHRVRVARTAGLDTIYVIVDTTGLSRDQIRAKQLAHNAIAGQDDRSILQSIFADIADIDLRVESAIDPAILNEKFDPIPISGLAVDMQTISTLLVFLPLQKDRFDDALMEIERAMAGTPDTVYLAAQQEYADWTNAVERIGKTFNVRSVPMIVSRMAKLALERIGVEQDDYGVGERVALGELFGTSSVTHEAAGVITAAVEKAQKEGDIPDSQLWTVLELICAEYLAS